MRSGMNLGIFLEGNHRGWIGVIPSFPAEQHENCWEAEGTSLSTSPDRLEQVPRQSRWHAATIQYSHAALPSAFDRGVGGLT